MTETRPTETETLRHLADVLADPAHLATVADALARYLAPLTDGLTPDQVRGMADAARAKRPPLCVGDYAAAWRDSTGIGSPVLGATDALPPAVWRVLTGHNVRRVYRLACGRTARAWADASDDYAAAD